MDLAIVRIKRSSTGCAGHDSLAQAAPVRLTSVIEIEREEAMRKAKAVGEMKIERPPPAVVTKKEALKRMKELSNRKDKFIASVRTSKCSLMS